MSGLPPWLAAWLLTYLLHSTAWLGTAWLLLRLRTWASPLLRERVWRVALVGSLVSPSLAVALPTAAAVPSPVETWPTEVVAGPSANGPVALEPDVATYPAGSLPIADSGPVLPDAPLLAPEPAPGPASPSLLVEVSRFLPFAWCGVAGLGLLLLGVGHLRVRRRLTARRALADGPLHAALERMLRPVPRAPRVHLSVSRGLPVPVAFGWRRAEICLPERALSELDAAQQRSMLGHELQHLLRRDPLVLGGVQLLARLLWLQPLNLLALRALRTAAEECCDAWAARRTGDPLAMASCLGEVAGWLFPSRRPLPTACMARPGSPLGHRIHRLLDAPDAAALLPAPRRGDRLRAGGTLLAGVVMAPLVLPAAAFVHLPVDQPATQFTLELLSDDASAAVDLLRVEAGALVDEIADLERALQARGDDAAQDASRRLTALRIRLTTLHARLATADAHFREAPGIPQD